MSELAANKDIGAKLDSEKTKDIRMTNIIAAKAISDVVRTSLGPRGMDKMIQDGKGHVLITNDGATILKQMEVVHPTAKMLVEISKAQDIEAGDGTTSVVVIAGALLKACQDLLSKGIHPSAISDGFQVALTKAMDIIDGMAQPVDLNNREQLIQNAITSLSSKVVSQHSDLLAPMAVDAVLRIIDKEHDTNVDLRDIHVSKKLGGTVDDSELIDGLVFVDKKATHFAGGPSKIKDAKIGLIQFTLSAPKTDLENNVVVHDYTAMDRILKEERKYILDLVKKISSTGCNVILMQKSILRDAVNDLALHFLAKKNILVIKDIDRDQIDFIAKTIMATPVAHVDHFNAEKLGRAALVSEVDVGEKKIVKITGCPNENKTVSILLRGSNQLVLDEADRSLHDALCVVRALVKKRALVPGGAAVEMEVAQKLQEYSRTIFGTDAYCVRMYGEALELIPYTLAENAGMDPINFVTELRNKHIQGDKFAGLNVRRNAIMNMLDENVVQPALVSISALTLATECVRMILKIDDIVLSR
jgi:T-complex protein 1 subunit delta